MGKRLQSGFNIGGGPGKGSCGILTLEKLKSQRWTKILKIRQLKKTMVVRSHLAMVAFNNITRLAFGKRFKNANSDVDEEGHEFKTIVNNGIKIGASLSVAEYIWYLRWLCPLNEELYNTTTRGGIV